MLVKRIINTGGIRSRRIMSLSLKYRKRATTNR